MENSQEIKLPKSLKNQMKSFKQKFFFYTIVMCGEIIHNELSSTEVFCPFCNVQISEPTVKKEKPCCRRMYVIFDNLNVCKNCGTIHGAPVIYDYIDFYQNMYKIKKKSIHRRKYHIQNVLHT